MDDNTVSSIWARAKREAANRSVGRFNRALVFGTNTPIYGQHKGLTGAKENLPGTIAKAGASIAVGFIPIPIAKDLLKKCVETAIDQVTAMVTDKPLERGVDKAKEMPAGGNLSAEQALRKRIDKVVGDLQKETLVVIDRNAAKLNAAQGKLTQAVQVLIGPKSATSVGTNETKEDQALAALRALAEVWYYTSKLKALVKGSQETLNGIYEKLGQLERKNYDTLGSMKAYMIYSF